MVICDAGRMFITLTIPLAFWFHALTMLQIYVVVAIAGILGTMFSIANTAALPNVMTREQLQLLFPNRRQRIPVFALLDHSLGVRSIVLGRSSHSW